MTDTLHISADINLIQQVRLIHAIAESDFGISLRPSEEKKFQILKEKFGLRFSTDIAGKVDLTDQISLSHSQPMTSIGEISRSLIFPHAVTNYCRSLWPDRRRFRYSFQGLLTGQRKLFIEQWISRNLPGQKARLPDPDSFVAKLRKKWRGRLGRDNTDKRQIGDLLLYSSDRGRIFPIKAWDEEYFNILANSQFVLCPSGDYVWSYRLFESILCGAIPIAEKTCAAYDGFRFHASSDNAGKFEWSAADAEYNYRLCVEKLTIPKSQLTEALAHIASAKKIG